jgi:hypothetical protein
VGVLKVLLCLIALAVFAAPRETAAQSSAGTETSALEVRKDALFQQMLHDPGNLDAAFAYAEVSAQLGDYEAAVSALERMLLFNPDLPRVQLEPRRVVFPHGLLRCRADLFRESCCRQSATRSPGTGRSVPGGDREEPITPSSLRLRLFWRPISNGCQRCRLVGYPVASRAGAAGQPVCQAGFGKHLRQRLGAVQLRSRDAEPGHAGRHVTSTVYLNHFSILSSIASTSLSSR